MKRCKLCKKILNGKKGNLYCSSCGNKTIWQLSKEGYKIIKEKNDI
jgi:uncharacterized Zn finger protein (UPF0148 family)